MNKVKTNYFSVASVGEIGLIFAYLLLWLFSVIASLVISYFDLHFSYVATYWQGRNLEIVGAAILISLVSGFLTGVLVLIGIKKILASGQPKILSMTFGRIECIILGVILVISSIGLFKSFGTTIFDGVYAGPRVIWLGYGAWSVTFLLALSMALGQIIVKRSLSVIVMFLICLLFYPFLLSGSRIDFLSFTLVLIVTIVCAVNEPVKVRVKKILILAVFVVPITIYIGTARYHFSDGLSPYILNPIRDDMFYLSTFGDLGVSVFQVVGLILEKGQGYVGFGHALSSYAHRLLPGSLFLERPLDLWLALPETIGGGALHALGEGYLIAGLTGCLIVGVTFGNLIALSILGLHFFRLQPTPIAWVIFVFPWLLLIRGGWYQFFSIFKSIEILFFILIFMAIISWAITFIVRQFCRVFCAHINLKKGG